MSAWVHPRYSGFLPQTKDVHLKTLICDFKLAVGVWMWWLPDSIALWWTVVHSRHTSTISSLDSLCAPPHSIRVSYKWFTCTRIQLQIQLQISCVSRLSFVCLSFFNPPANNQIKGQRNLLLPSALSTTESHISAVWFRPGSHFRRCMWLWVAEGMAPGLERRCCHHTNRFILLYDWRLSDGLVAVIVSGLRGVMSGRWLGAQVRRCRMLMYGEMIEAWQISLWVENHTRMTIWKYNIVKNDYCTNAFI